MKIKVRNLHFFYNESFTLAIDHRLAIDPCRAINPCPAIDLCPAIDPCPAIDNLIEIINLAGQGLSCRHMRDLSITG